MPASPFVRWTAWRWLRALAAGAALVIVAACEGGGGTSGDTSAGGGQEQVLQAPRIVEQPSDLTVKPGEAARFSVRAESEQALSYQWQRNGVDIPGATASTYELPGATTQDAGARLRAVVRNASGESVSNEATLRVEGAAPQVLRIVQFAVVSPGQPFTVTVTVAGNPPFDYQWLRNGEPVEGASGTSPTSTMTLGPLALTERDDGVALSVVVKTAEGTVRSPDAVISVVGRERIAAGSRHSLALSADGATVWAWGSNAAGQLGDGGTSSRATPAPVAGLSGVVAVSAGEHHSLALKADGTVWAWGSNARGALGDGTTVDRPVAARVPGLDRVFAIAAGGERSFAMRADGTVWGWGENSTGALGIGTLTDALVPTQVGVGVPGFGNVIRMAAGQRHTLALRIDGQVFQFGALIPTSPATTGPQVRPSLVEGLAGVTLVTAGDRLSVALDVNGGLWSWGPNGRGQLGLGASGTRAVPTRIGQSDDGSPMPPVLRVAAGPDFVTARAFDGTLLSWGAGSEGQLGTGALLDRALPTRAGPLSGPLQSIAAGGVHAFAALADATLDAWGANDAGQLGGATAASKLPSPSPVPNLDLD